MKLNHRIKAIIPNAVTCAGLSLGVISILLSLHHRYIDAAWFIILCCLFDKLDGTVARLLNATSDIGLQLDSLSDLVTFGIAPGVLVYSMLNNYVYTEATSLIFVWALKICVFCLVLASALRLARFNTTKTKLTENYFQGLPTTLSGGIISAIVLTLNKYQITGFLLDAVPFYVIILSALMLSRVPLPKLKRRPNKYFDWFQTGNIILVYVFGIIRILPEYLLVLSLFYPVIGFPYSLINRKAIEALEKEPVSIESEGVSVSSQ